VRPWPPRDGARGAPDDTRPAARLPRPLRLLRPARLSRLRRGAGAALAEGFFRYASRLGALHPDARPERHGLDVLRDVPYDDPAAHPARRLDVYRPKGARDPLPTLLYVHGGGFRILSKDTHWVMALAFARRGFVVFNVDYRLAPRHRFPAAVEDVSAAYAWLARHAPAYGADPDRLVLAGESAGANLVTALTLAACFERPEPHARAVFETGVVPRCVLPACGLFQVSDPARFARRKPGMSRFVRDRIEEVAEAYLGAGHRVHTPGEHDLADPVCFLEREAGAPARPLPPFFLPVGTADPLLDDTRRLAAALERRGVPVEVRIYEGEIHAFHAFVFRPKARLCWQHQYAFLDTWVPRPPAEAPRG
jgi:acetyl esterase